MGFGIDFGSCCGAGCGAGRGTILEVVVWGFFSSGAPARSAASALVFGTSFRTFVSLIIIARGECRTGIPACPFILQFARRPSHTIQTGRRPASVRILPTFDDILRPLTDGRVR